MKKISIKNLFLLGGVFSGFSVMAAVCPGGISTDVFDYSGSIVTYTVPVGATELRIVVSGAEGGNNIAGGSAITPGLGAQIEGDFLVNSGDQFQLLVGEQPSLTTGGGNGGGGGSYVTDMLNNPVIIAGGGSGSSQTTDSLEKHGQAGTAGGTGSAGGGLGGTAGSGGNAGASGFQSGAGGGLLTDGQDGWTTNTGGDAFINAGAGATQTARGGFGGGGSGSGWVVGGGGGGYSGGGSGGNTTGGVGGGGGSFNSGTSQVNTAGIRAGHGQIQICASSGITTDLSVVKDLTSTGPYNVGDSVTYSITVANAGPDAASNIVVSDTMTNLTLVSLSGGTCAPASFPCTIPSMANGGSEVLTVTASINANGMFDNSVTVSATEFDSNLANNTDDTGNDGATAVVDLSVVKDLTSTGPYNVGDSVTYSITVANAGPDAASNVVVSDTMTNLTLVSLSGGTCAPAGFPCTIPSIANGGSEVLTVTASITADGVFDNSVTVTAAEFDSNTGNNTDDTGNDGATTAVDLSVVKDLTSTGPYNVGDTVTYSITIANAGPDAASNVVVSDTMTNLTMVSLTGGTCTPASFPCTIPSLANGGSETLTVTATIPTSGAFDNSASVTYSGLDTNPSNNIDDTGNNGIAVAIEPQVVPTIGFFGVLFLMLMLIFFASRFRQV